MKEISEILTYKFQVYLRPFTEFASRNMFQLKVNGYNLEPFTFKRQCMHYLFDGNYPQWPMFIEPRLVLNMIGKNLLSKAHDTIKKEIEVFFQ